MDIPRDECPAAASAVLERRFDALSLQLKLPVPIFSACASTMPAIPRNHLTGEARQPLKSLSRKALGIEIVAGPFAVSGTGAG